MVCRGSPELTFMCRQGTSTVVSLSILSLSLSPTPLLFLSMPLSLSRVHSHTVVTFNAPFATFSRCLSLSISVFISASPHPPLTSPNALFRLSRSVGRFFSGQGSSSLEVKEKRVRLGKAPLCRRPLPSMLLNRMC